MYQYILNWFVGLFLRSIADSARSDTLSRRLDAINQHFTYALYCNVCRSLFEKDKLLFAFLMASRILAFHGRLPPAELHFLITGGAGVAHDHLSHQPDNPAPSWVSERAWNDLLKLSRVGEAFATLPLKMALTADSWKKASGALHPLLAAVQHCTLPPRAPFLQLPLLSSLRL